MQYNRSTYRSSSTFTTRRGYFLNRIGGSMSIFSGILLFFTDQPNKHYIAIPGLLLGFLLIGLGRKYRHAKPQQGIEYDENGNIKPKRL